MSTDFIVFPAIDLRNGQVVRLKEGDPNRQTNYGNDPASTAERWINAGAKWLHVVNLDGAFEQSDTANQRALQSILKTAQKHAVNIQFGGGLRNLDAINQIMDLGVNRAILGTAVIKNPEILEEALSKWGSERVAVSLDARDGKVQVRGWQEATQLDAVELARSYQREGLKWMVFTDISRDGLQTGVNLAATVELAKASGLKVIASGGVKSLADVQAARKANLTGIITGRALYEGAIDPAQLFQDSPVTPDKED